MNAKRARSSRRGGGSCSVTAARNLGPCAGRARPRNSIPRRKLANVLYVWGRKREGKKREKKKRDGERFRRGLFALFDAVAILWHAWHGTACSFYELTEQVHARGKTRMWNLVKRLTKWDHSIGFRVIEKYQRRKIQWIIPMSLGRVRSKCFYLWAISAISSWARIGLSSEKYEKHNWAFCSSKQQVAANDLCQYLQFSKKLLVFRYL